VQPALFESAAVVQRSCTTGIEAGLAGRPTFSPQWVTAPWLMPAAEAVSVPCTTYEELAERLQAVLDGRYVQDPRISAAIAGVIDDWFCAIDGRSYRRVAETVLAALPTRRPSVDRLQERNLYLASAAGVRLEGVAALGGRVRQAGRLSPEFSFRALRHRPVTAWTRTSKFFDAARVQALADRMLPLLGARIRAVPARERGENRHRIHAHAVTLTRS
jgi:hypothetical protein